MFVMQQSAYTILMTAIIIAVVRIVSPSETHILSHRHAMFLFARFTIDLHSETDKQEHGVTMTNCGHLSEFVRFKGFALRGCGTILKSIAGS